MSAYVKGISNKYIEYHNSSSKKEDKNDEKGDGLFEFLNRISPTLGLFAVLIFVSLILSSVAASISISLTSNFQILKLNNGSDYVYFADYNDKLVSKKLVKETNTLEKEIYFLELDDINYMYSERIEFINVEK